MTTPAGWPREVPPPGAPDWERKASNWLFDLCPGDYRSYEVLRRHPQVLARLAKVQVESAIAAARDGWSTARVEWKELEPATRDAVISMYEREGARLSAVLREVTLVERALSKAPPADWEA